MSKETPDWYKNLITNDKDNPRPNFANVMTALREAPELAFSLGFDELRNASMAIAELPWDVPGPFPRPWTPNDDRALAEWLQRGGLNIGILLAREGVQLAASEHPYHPIRKYLESVKWDEETRLDEWAPAYLGCPDMPYTREVGAKWMISAVARVYEPGCKADCVLVLEGPQGTFKSTALRILGTPWFTDELAPLGSKDAAEQLIGMWIVEMAELDALTRADHLAAAKAFISRSTDRCRLPYAERSGEYRRQCVFAATTNTDQWNRDPTGGRRWWPLSCGKIDIERLEDDRDQLWAEALTRYRKDAKWHLTDPAIIADATEEQNARRPEDPWLGTVAEFIRPLASTTTEEILSRSPLNVLKERQDGDAAGRVGKILHQLGWSTKRPRTGSLKRPRIYYPP